MAGALYDTSKPTNRPIREMIKATHAFSPHRIYQHGKRFGIKRGTYWELDTEDGIGTKGKLHWQMDTVGNGADDAFAMVVDDLAEGGYDPVWMWDHLMVQEEHHDRIYRIIGRLVELCKMHNVSLMGGETAVHNTLEGFELGIHGRGRATDAQRITAHAEPGDILIGIESNRSHSNGFSFYRNILLDQEGMKLDTPVHWGGTLGEELVLPTRIYLPALRELNATYHDTIHGMVHITGGGLTKPHEFLPADSGLDAYITRNHMLQPHDIFKFSKQYQTSEQMYTRFNNGIGYVIAVAPKEKDSVLKVLRKYFPADTIGGVEKNTAGKNRVLIESVYENKVLTF